MAKGAEVIDQFGLAQTRRQPLDSHYAECFKYTYPLRGVGFNSDPFISAESASSTALSQQSSMTDSTAPDSCRIVASAIVSGMTPSNYVWFGLGVDDSDPKVVKDFLDNSCPIVHREIHSSNFDAPNYESILDMVIGGSSVLFIDEGKESLYNFGIWPLYSCYYESSRRGGPVDIIYRPFSMTVRQAVNEYGISAVSEKIRKAYNDKKFTELHKFVLCIRPRVEAEPGKKKRGKSAIFGFESLHVEHETKKVVKEAGFHEFPCAIPRYLKFPDSPYAEGVVSAALPDIKTLNRAETMTLDNGELAMAGMWGAVDDGVLNPKTVRIGPRRIIFMRDPKSFFPLAPGGKFDISNLILSEKRAAVKRTLMADLLETNSQGPAKTATEWHIRLNLLRQLLGPTYGRLQEYLQQVIFRCFMIALRGGRLGRPPPEMQQANFTPRYKSPLARAQQAEELNAIREHEADLVALAQIKPEVLDQYNWDEAQRSKADLRGVPQKLIPDEKDVQKKREARSKAQQQQQAQEQQQAAMQQMGKQAGAQQ